MESGIDLCGSVSERPFLIRVSSLRFSADLDRFLMEIAESCVTAGNRGF